MEKEIQGSIDILKDQKKKLIDKIKNNSEDNKIQLFKNIEEIDKLLESYYFKINKCKIKYLKTAKVYYIDTKEKENIEIAQDNEKNIKNQKDDNIDHKEKIQYKI